MPELFLTSTETVQIVEESPEVLVVEVTYGEPGKPPPAHYHPSQAERFEVSEGELSTKVGGKERVLRPLATLDIPAGAVHQMWNAGPAPVKARWEVRPALRTADLFRGLDRLHREGRTSLPALAALLNEYDDVFRLARVPKPLLKVLGKFG